MIQELVFGLLLIPAALPDPPLYRLAGLLLLIAFLLAFPARVGLLQEHVAQLGLRLMGKIPFLNMHVPQLEELRKHVALVAYTKEAILRSALDLASIVAMGSALLCWWHSTRR